MEKVNIFWDPEGITLDQTSKKTYASPLADGDTPYRVHGSFLKLTL